MHCWNHLLLSHTPIRFIIIIRVRYRVLPHKKRTFFNRIFYCFKNNKVLAWIRKKPRFFDYEQLCWQGHQAFSQLRVATACRRFRRNVAVISSRTARYYLQRLFMHKQILDLKRTLQNCAMSFKECVSFDDTRFPDARLRTIKVSNVVPTVRLLIIHHHTRHIMTLRWHCHGNHQRFTPSAGSSNPNGYISTGPNKPIDERDQMQNKAE